MSSILIEFKGRNIIQVMRTNYLKLKEEFFLYLSVKKNIDIDLDKVSSMSIFSYDYEFRDFISDKFDVDKSELSLSLDDLLNMKFNEGEFVIEEEVYGESEENYTENINKEEESEDKENVHIKDILLECINDFISDKSVKGKIDTDGNSELSGEEINAFIKKIAANDENSGNISLDDIMGTFKQINNSTFDNDIKTIDDKAVSENIKEEASTLDTGKNKNMQQNIKTGSNSGASSSGSTGSGGSRTTLNNNHNIEENTNNYTLEELQSLRNEKQTNLDTIRNSLKMYHQEENNEVNDARKKYEEAVRNDEKITEELKQEQKENSENISKKEQEINSNKAKLIDINSNIANFTSIINAKNSEISALQAVLSNLNPATAKDDEAKAEIESKKSEAEAKIETAEAEKNDAQTKLNEFNVQKQKIENQISTQEEEYNALKEKEAEIAEKISKNCSDEVKKALEDYKKVQEETSAIIKQAEETVNSLQEEINNLDKQINEKRTEDIKKAKETDIKSSSVFAKNVNYANLGYFSDESGMSYLLIGPDDLKEGEKVPMCVFLHGTGEASFGEDKLLQSSLPYTLLNGQTMLSHDKFNFEENPRCIFCFPQLPTTQWWWTNDKAENCLRSIIGNVCSKYNIDKNNIVLGGHSKGGQGAVYMAKKLEDIIKKAVVISGSKAPANIDASTINIPVKGYYAAREGDDYMSGEFSSVFGKENVIEMEYDQNGNRIKHGDSSGVAFAQDEDNNGHSDIFEFLFS